MRENCRPRSPLPPDLWTETPQNQLDVPRDGPMPALDHQKIGGGLAGSGRRQNHTDPRQLELLRVDGHLVQVPLVRQVPDREHADLYEEINVV